MTRLLPLASRSRIDGDGCDGGDDGTLKTCDDDEHDDDANHWVPKITTKTPGTD